jgi:3-hydroxy-9,10-secoandrosta-1,3,5(10)-triene-9,17-dione monooxygenase
MSTYTLLDRARSMTPMLLERAAGTERDRRVATDVVDALAEAGILRMCAPARYGGAQTTFEDQVDVLAQLARGCPSTSWVATILSAMAWMAATFPDEAQDEVFGDGDPRVSGVLAPTGSLTPVPGGYRLTGKWAFNTGGEGSRWAILNAILDGMPTATLVPMGDLMRIDDWHASGMAGTGSSSVVADDVPVPAHRTQPTPPMIGGVYPSERHNAADPYFNLPLASVLAVNAGGTPVGTARGALDAFLERLPGRGITYTFWEDQSQAQVTHLQVGESALLADSAEDHVKRACATLDHPADGIATSERERAEARSRIGYATGLARRAVDILFEASGASAIQGHVPIQRFQRDMQALANHAIMHGPTHVEMWGRTLLGLPPQSVLV